MWSNSFCNANWNTSVFKKKIKNFNSNQQLCVNAWTYRCMYSKFTHVLISFKRAKPGRYKIKLGSGLVQSLSTFDKKDTRDSVKETLVFSNLIRKECIYASCCRKQGKSVNMIWHLANRVGKAINCCKETLLIILIFKWLTQIIINIISLLLDSLPYFYWPFKM